MTTLITRYVTGALRETAIVAALGCPTGAQAWQTASGGGVIHHDIVRLPQGTLVHSRFRSGTENVAALRTALGGLDAAGGEVDLLVKPATDWTSLTALRAEFTVQEGRNAELPFDQRSTATLQAATKKVFAHWHFFPISIDNAAPASDYWATEWLVPSGESNAHLQTGGFCRHRPLGRAPLTGDWDQKDCERDIRNAVAVGIDGFMYNVLSISADASWGRFVSMLDAADALVSTGFRIIPNIDATVVAQANRAALVTMLQGIIGRSCILQIGGTPVVSAFGAESWNTSNWQSVITDLGCKLVQIFVTFTTANTPATTYGAGVWGSRSSPDINSNSPATTTHGAGRIWVEPVAPQDCRPGNPGVPASSTYWEADNSLLLRTMFAEATDVGAEWIQLITWNDHAENSIWWPSTAGQYAYHDLLAYYIETFKVAAPTIVRDVLYYFHRIEPTTVTYNTSAQPNPMIRAGTAAASNTIECLAFLVSSGTIEIEINSVTTQFAGSAGINSFEIALPTSGTPIFRLVRSGNTVISVTSAFTVRNSVTYQDFVYRGGGSTRAVVPLVANPA